MMVGWGMSESGTGWSGLHQGLRGLGVFWFGGVVYLVSRAWQLVDMIGIVGRLQEEGRSGALRTVVGLGPGAVSFGFAWRY